MEPRDYRVVFFIQQKTCPQGAGLIHIDTSLVGPPGIEPGTDRL